jgi:hypothetical protein
MLSDLQAFWADAGPLERAGYRIGVALMVSGLFHALLMGAVMIARGVTEVVAGHQQRAYLVGGFLKPGHAATMHGILILSALAWLTSFTGWTERRRRRIVSLATAGYGLFAAAVIAESLIGESLVAFGFAGLGAITLLTSGVITLASLTSRATASTHSRRLARAARLALDRGAFRLLLAVTWRIVLHDPVGPATFRLKG